MCLVSFNVWKLTRRNSCKSQKTPLVCRKWYNSNKLSLLTALHRGSPSWIMHDISTKWRHQSELKPRGSMFPDYSIIPSSHLSINICAIHCILSYLCEEVDWKTDVIIKGRNKENFYRYTLQDKGPKNFQKFNSV